MRYSILFGGEAGQGPNILSQIIGEVLVESGYYVFYSRDYQSLIRGGHNFNVLTFSEEMVYSNDSKVDILVCLDENTKKIHKKELKKNGILLEKGKENMYYAGRIIKLLCMDFKILEKRLKKLKRFEENIEKAKQGYEEETKNICRVNYNKNKNYFMNGNQGISQGAIKSEMDIYYAYPMTPATPVLSELAQESVDKDFFTIELENEIAVVNAGIGSAITGAKTMVGTSGGGFDLMTEGLSLTGIAEVPLVFYLSMRPGPGTGVATYTSQGDLNIARHSGHGEFQRLVVAPGDPKESQELTNQAFYFSQKYKIPSIIVSDKHLGESFYTLEKEPEIKEIKYTTKLSRYNSYEKDSEGSATEDPELIKKNILKRQKKIKEIEKDSLRFKIYKIYGKKDSENVIVSWGSTKGVIIDAIKDLDVKFVQVLYIEPFPLEIIKELKENIILVENNSTGEFGNLIKEKTGFSISEKNKILRFDGRPFLADELKKEIEKRLR